MRLAHPHLLWLLLLVPAAVLAYAVASVARRRALARLGSPDLIARMSPATSRPRKVARAALLCIALGLLAAALARPQAGGRARLEKQRGLDLVVALDFSKSMLAKDIYPSRLERAKRELEQLMDRLNGDRVGLVAFAGETLTYPPTTDYDAVKLFWRDLSPADLPVGGTAIGRAITAAVDMLTRLRAQGGETRDQVILLLTDGEDTESNPLQAAEEAAKVGVKVFAVGIGSRSGELVPDMGESDQAAGYMKDRDGKYVTSRLDEDLLAQIAGRTGGDICAPTRSTSASRPSRTRSLASSAPRARPAWSSNMTRSTHTCSGPRCCSCSSRLAWARAAGCAATPAWLPSPPL